MYKNIPPRLPFDLYRPPKSEKIRTKIMFFPYIFVNIDHREMIIDIIIVRLVLIHKSNSIQFLSKWHSFRVFGCQSWHKLHIAVIKWSTREVNVNVGMCGSVDFLINFITRLLCVGAT